MLLLGAVAAIGIGWSWLWTQAAARLDTEVDRGLAQLARRGVEAKCLGRRLEGYPFRIGVFCDRVEIADAAERWQFDAQALRTAAQAYKPGHAVIELDGPAQLQLPRRPQLSGTWRLARGSVRFGLSGFARASFEVTEANLLAFGVRPMAQAERIEAHARPGAAADSLDLALSAAALKLLAPVEAGPYDVSAEGTLEGISGIPAGASDLREWLRQNGLRGRFDRLRLAAGEGAVLLSGTFDVSPQGLLSGQFRIEARNSGQLIAALAPFYRDREDLAEAMSHAATALSLAGDPAVAEFAVKNGDATLGILPIGKLPPLF